MKRTKLDDPRHYLNRHVQWLDFNRRVLEEARDIGNPLLERVKFLAITANNLDEFVEIRVSSFLQRIEHGSREISPDGLTTEEELERVSTAMHVFVRDQYKCWNDELLPALAKQSIWVLSTGELEPKAAKFTKTFYDRRVNPMLTPVTVDPSHPFPHVLNKALCIAFVLRRRRGGNGKPYFGVLTVPRALPRLLRVPTENGGIRYAFLQDIISTYASKLYRGYEILASTAFRITRNSNLYLEQEESRTLLETIDSQVAQRRKGVAVFPGVHIERPLIDGTGRRHLPRLAVHAGTRCQRKFVLLRGRDGDGHAYRHARGGHSSDMPLHCLLLDFITIEDGYHRHSPRGLSLTHS